MNGHLVQEPAKLLSHTRGILPILRVKTTLLAEHAEMCISTHFFTSIAPIVVAKWLVEMYIKEPRLGSCCPLDQTTTTYLPPDTFLLRTIL